MKNDKLEFVPMLFYDDYVINQMGQIKYKDNLVSVAYINNTPVVWVKNEEGWKKISLAKLVAWTFLGQPDNPDDVAYHKDGDLTNCAASNLEWSSRSDAYRKMYKEKNRYCASRIEGLRKKLSKPVVAYTISDDVKTTVKKYSSVREASSDLKVSTAAICRALSNQEWRCCGLAWEYDTAEEK